MDFLYPDFVLYFIKMDQLHWDKKISATKLRKTVFDRICHPRLGTYEYNSESNYRMIPKNKRKLMKTPNQNLTKK